MGVQSHSSKPHTFPASSSLALCTIWPIWSLPSWLLNIASKYTLKFFVLLFKWNLEFFPFQRTMIFFRDERHNNFTEEHITRGQSLQSLQTLRVSLRVDHQLTPLYYSLKVETWGDKWIDSTSESQDFIERFINTYLLFFQFLPRSKWVGVELGNVQVSMNREQTWFMGLVSLWEKLSGLLLATILPQILFWCIFCLQKSAFIWIVTFFQCLLQL